MRLMSHILAVVLAISTIAVPCLAKVQVETVNEVTNVTVIVQQTENCNGPCVKAIISRKSELDHVAIVFESGSDLVTQSSQQVQFPIIRTAGVPARSKVQCSNGVDLYFLCRQLN